MKAKGHESSIQSKAEPQQLSSPPATPLALSRPRNKSRITSSESGYQTRDGLAKAQPLPSKRSGTRTRAYIKKEDVNELPHNLGSAVNGPLHESNIETNSPTKKRKPHAFQKPLKSAQKVEGADTILTKAAAVASSPPTKPSKKLKSNSYGLTPGQTPYPDWPHPTPSECEEVTRLLESVHGKVQPPKSIPLPSLTVSGCGEVPSVLDALIRTRLSAATSNTNSSRAFTGLVSRFGVLQEGVGKGSVDWDAVRRADVKEIFEAIKSGGLADVKSKDIKAILQMVWEENRARHDALLSSRAKGAGPQGAENESAEEKDAEIARADESVLSLDHLHLLSNDDAFNALTKYPGIGPKTASCVLLFCLQRPSFAVDTHVFRLCKWLGWVPASKATRNSTYAHCEVRVPDELKYPLHQLLIRHGRTCPRCRAATSERSTGWEEGCVIDHLVTRSSGRKAGGSRAKEKVPIGVRKGKGKTKAKKSVDNEDSSDNGLESEDNVSEFGGS
ncbi:DNA glycosylase [Glonium stellatum]|uniref:DNA glycosylase n=1 Tax=Glonium stellatum TaxID=574774 RepID=A0A8E2ERJ7_9PEZI|nr:DNA glycosylase [Glonium stellatum]